MRLKPVRARFEFKLADMWIGLFWKKGFDSNYGGKIPSLDVWVCFLPCIPLHLRFGGKPVERGW